MPVWYESCFEVGSLRSLIIIPEKMKSSREKGVRMLIPKRIGHVILEIGFQLLPQVSDLIKVVYDLESSVKIIWGVCLANNPYSNFGGKRPSTSFLWHRNSGY